MLKRESPFAIHRPILPARQIAALRLLCGGLFALNQSKTIAVVDSLTAGQSCNRPGQLDAANAAMANLMRESVRRDNDIAEGDRGHSTFS